MDKLKVAGEHFAKLVKEQMERVEQMKQSEEAVDFKKLDEIIIGCCGGDGIGPAITEQAERVLREVLKEDVDKGRIVFKTIEGLTIENRIAQLKAIPEDVLEELKACHVILKAL